MSFKLCYYFNWLNFIRALVMKSEGMACASPHFFPCALLVLLRSRMRITFRHGHVIHCSRNPCAEKGRVGMGSEASVV